MVDTVESLLQELARQKKINGALMSRVERDMDARGDAFSLFQAAAVLEKQVHERTRALEDALEELKRSNRELRHAKDAAELAARSKDEFLAGMSHELRTPLNAVLGLAEILQEEVYGPVNSKQLESLRTIEASGRHLLSLINDILEIARMGAGQLKPDMSDVDLADLCHACIGLIRPQAQKKALRIECVIGEWVGVARTDGRRLKQIVLNLLGNAVKFTERGGQIGLEVRRRDQEYLIVVSDTGVGIREEDRARIFLPFVQLDSGLSRKYEGTGLGLALVQRFVALLGGHIEVESEPGKGSQFMVYLPMELGFALEPHSISAGLTGRGVQPASSGRLILLAEDNPANINTVGEYLKAKGYRVETATNGVVALQKVRELKPDLVLMDVQMPEMDGLEAIRRIRGELGLHHLPVVALTALAMVGDQDRCMQAGASAYVSKPVSLRQLVALIDAQLSLGRVSFPAGNVES
jgi:signal transduction histidine kinase/ActR/RegA family two-component response regulator